MTQTFTPPIEKKAFAWRRELAPVLAVAGLAADYLSPPALWTILLPLGCALLLLALRRWASAGVVLLLSSWFLIPAAAGMVVAVEDAGGQHRMFLIDDTAIPTIDEAVADPCIPGDLGFEALPIGPGHLLDPQWAMRGAILSFVDLHNAMVIERAHREGPAGCGGLTPAH